MNQKADLSLEAKVVALAQERDRMKASYKEKSGPKRAAITAEIGDIIRKGRAAGSVDSVTEERFHALKAERAPLLRPLELEGVQLQLRAARQKLAHSRVLELAETYATLDDAALEARSIELGQLRGELLDEHRAVAMVLSERRADAERRNLRDSLTREQKLALLEDLKRELEG